MSKVIEILSSLTVPSLTEHIGYQKAQALADCGIQVTSENLAQALYLEKGLGVFKSKSLRAELLANLGVDKLKEIYGHNESFSRLVVSESSFSWGNNKKTKNFLENIGIEDVDLSPSEAKLQIDSVSPSSPLHGYQDWVRKKIVSFMRADEERRAIVHMPTGAGKTRTSLEAVCDYLRQSIEKDVTIVWLAHSQELCQQSLESFERLWSRLGTTKVNMYGLWGGAELPKSKFEGFNFIVISFQTAYSFITSNRDENFSKSQEISRKCKLIIVDEAHQSVAPTYQIAIEGLSSFYTKILGLTATPGRHHIGGDEADTKKLSDFYENRKLSISDGNGEYLDNPIEYLTNLGVLARVQRFQIQTNSDLKLSQSELLSMQKFMDIPDSVLKRLGEDAQRTNLVATQALKLAVEMNYQTIIFAPSKENSILLAILLKMRGCEAESVTSEMMASDRQQAIEKFKNGEIQVLTNFGVLTTGFDSPNIKAVIIARPTLSVVLYSQMVGRGLRGPAMGGESECIIVDVVDNITNMPSADQAFTYFDDQFN